jgi:hypothetical protein
VRQRRAEVERALAGLPLKDSEFEKRNAGVDTSFVALNKQLSGLEVQLLGMEAQVVATERFISDTMRDPAQQSGVEAYRAELSTQQKAIADYREQIERIELEVETGRIQVGVGDSTYVRDDQLRAEHADLVAQERRLIGGNGRTDPLYQRIDNVEATIAQHDAAIDKVVSERSAAMQKVLDEEGGKLVGYRERLVELDGETEDVVGGITYANFRKVQHRFYDLVLKADVGIVDVGWAEREEHRARIDMLTRERNRALQALDEEFREITDERGKQ